MREQINAAAAALWLGVVPVPAHAADVLAIQVPRSIAAQPGSVVHVLIQLAVKPGYHVQANPVENPDLIPITLAVQPAAGVSTAEPVYPRAKRMRLPGDTQDLVIYDGAFAIVLPLRISKDSKPGDVLGLKGTLRYQACDDSHCLFPVSLPVAFGVTIVDR